MGGNGFSIGGTNFDQLWRAAEQKLKDSGNSSPTTADIVNEIRRLNPKPPTVDSPIPGFHFEHNDSVPTMKYGANIPQNLTPTMKYGVHLPSVFLNYQQNMPQILVAYLHRLFHQVVLQ